LAQRGIKVYGVDLSPVMCRLARSKARRAGANVNISPADMRTFRLPEPVDLITCEFDAVNHVPRKSDLARVASAVARALRPGGYFYFDVNNRLAFQKIWPGTSWFEKPGVVMVMRGAYDERRDKGLTDVEWFVLRKVPGGDFTSAWSRWLGRGWRLLRPYAQLAFTVSAPMTRTPSSTAIPGSTPDAARFMWPKDKSPELDPQRYPPRMILPIVASCMNDVPS